MKFAVKTGATILPVTLQEVKDHLRITHDTQDALLLAYIKSAINDTELHTGLTLASVTFYGYLPYFNEYNSVKKHPVTAVTSVKYYDENNALQTLAPANYEVDMINFPAVIKITGTMPSTYERADAVTVEFTAGYTSALIPDGIKAAILLQVGYLYENSGDNPKQLITASERLLQSFRLFHSDWF